jgi:hypothetical protein
MVAWALLALAIAGTPPLMPETDSPLTIDSRNAEPNLDLGKRKFALPSVDYRAPDGTWKHGNGIIVGRDISESTTVGIGFFKMKPKSQEGLSSPPVRKSHKVSLGFSMRF